MGHPQGPRHFAPWMSPELIKAFLAKEQEEDARLMAERGADSCRPQKEQPDGQ